MAIQAIETSYAGCRFRSRLEARWAVYFDALGVAWEYEPQGFLVGPSRHPYLPDFRLDRPGLSPLWVEVKGSDAALDVGLLAAAVNAEAGIGGPILVLGPVPEPVPTPLHTVIRPVFGRACMHKVLLHPQMGLLQIGCEYELDEPAVLGPMVAAATTSGGWTMPEFALPPVLEDAYRAARSARFEHGERGR